MTEETIFIAALEKDSPAERAAFLDAACGEDAALRRRVEALLASHADPRFLETPAVQRPTEPFEPARVDDTPTEPAAPDTGADLGFLAPTDRLDSLGRLGHYEVLEVVGRGGMGVVLKAFDEQLHRIVALKVMAPQLATSASARARFGREARAAAAVVHDHVVTIHAVEADGPLPRLVMQYVTGRSLQDRLDRSGPLPVREVLRIGMQAAAGLAAAHAQGLVHRDVKPANILLENGVERVKLTDFGLARAADDASLTQSGTVAGTPQYMSPEQAEGKPVDARSDLFSIGSVLYAACAGRPPFRAASSMAVLKRVCEDTPTPVRDINPDVPDSLAAVIARLHAKDPGNRYQTAAEVADVLARLLAELQQPAGASPPAAPPVAVPGAPAAGPPPRPARGRRWTAAAAVLLAVAAALAATEAAGVTSIGATVIRVLTPDGTLMIEADDPDVKVTVEGDGGLVIAGAGAQEVRVRPGSYRVHAIKDGKALPVDREMVSITRGGKQVVRVRLENGGSAAGPAKAEGGAFVVLGGRGTPARRFDTLAEALAAAADGGTVEICGNGPFVCEPVVVEPHQPLILRAGPGYRPVVRMSRPAAEGPAALIHAKGPLVVEGIEFQRLEGSKASAAVSLIASYAPLAFANCRFVRLSRGAIVSAVGSPRAHVRNCEFVGTIGPYYDFGWIPRPGAQLTVENCVLLSSGSGFILTPRWNPGLRVRYAHNTFATDIAIAIGAPVRPPGPKAPVPAGHEPPLRIDAVGNVFASRKRVLNFGQTPSQAKQAPPSGQEADDLFRATLRWAGSGNLYPPAPHLLGYTRHDPPADLPGGQAVATLTDWQAFWGSAEERSAQAPAQFAGGEGLSDIAWFSPGAVHPERFRLRPDSPGYRAAPGGKDLGADVDLVGPGAAYDRWKATPEYQSWLKDTGQVKN